jgi:hypothetical protein
MRLSIRFGVVPFDLSPLALLVIAVIWLAATALTIAAAAAIVVRLPPSYFCEDDAHHAARSWRSPRGFGRNVLGLALIVLGLLLSIPGVPGQGLLTLLIGLMLVDFPGRRRAEKALARRRGILAAMNRIRARFGHAPLLPPPD